MTNFMIAQLASSARCVRIAGAARLLRGVRIGAASPLVRHREQRRSAMAASIGSKQDMLNTPVWRRDLILHAAQPDAVPAPLHAPVNSGLLMALQTT